MDYEMEELLPVVAALADKYTLKESTSVSYACARQLMEAVLYCIHQCNGREQLVSSKGISAKEAYQYGYECLLEKVRITREIYNAMIQEFCAYGNENYQATVEKAIPGFFKYYDTLFAPQDTLITMDYPTICPVMDEHGIDAISKYVEYISYEQKFMNILPREYVYEVLYKFQPDYKKQFYNICSIILRHILCHMCIGKKLGEESTEKDNERLRDMVLDNDIESMEKIWTENLSALIHEKYDADMFLERYLQWDLKNFSVEMQSAAKHDTMKNVIVL